MILHQLHALQICVGFYKPLLKYRATVASWPMGGNDFKGARVDFVTTFLHEKSCVVRLSWICEFTILYHGYCIYLYIILGFE